MDLLHVSDPKRELSPALLEARGGFAWWYADLLDAQGSGAVVIWSFGLPFLPGYLDSARRGRPQRPAARPSLNVALYERGRPCFYLLQEYPETQCDWRGDTVRMGDSVLTSQLMGDRRVLRAQLDCPLPGTKERLRGAVEAEGPAPRFRPRQQAPSALEAHQWSLLLGAAEGAAHFNLGGQPLLHVRGRSYHDRNGCSRPFDRIGIEHWIWSRVPFEDREAIVYLLWPETNETAPSFVGLEVDRSGRTREMPELSVGLNGPCHGRYRMPFWKSLSIRSRGRPWLHLTLQERLEDGPFYLRFAVQGTTAHGERAVGTSELVRPERVDVPWQRPFVRMRVHHTKAPNSKWLPLFCGAAGGRAQRLAQSALGRRFRLTSSGRSAGASEAT